MILDIDIGKAPAAIKFSLMSMSSMKENPFNPRVEVFEGDEYWSGEMTFKNLNPIQTRAMRSFINQCRGTAGQFWVDDVSHTQIGNWSGSIVVDGDNQDGIELSIKGAEANESIAPMGDRFQLGEHLYELTHDVAADSTGRAVLRFLPDIRIIPNDGQALITESPKCKCLLTPNQTPAQGTATKKLLSEYKFKFRECLR